MSKIMNAEQWLNHNEGVVNGELRVDPILACEEYHKYRKSVEICANCKHKHFLERYYSGGECVGKRRNPLPNGTCEKWEEREG